MHRFRRSFGSKLGCSRKSDDAIEWKNEKIPNSEHGGPVYVRTGRKSPLLGWLGDPDRMMRFSGHCVRRRENPWHRESTYSVLIESAFVGKT